MPWVFARCDELSLQLRSVSVESKNASTINGVQVAVQGVTHVKISGYMERDGVLVQDDNSLRLAAQHFLGSSDEDIEYTISSTLEGHQRAIIGTLTVEEIYRDRQAFSDQVRKLAVPDLRNMGLDLVSYTITSIADNEHYLESLGVTQTELVKRHATEGKALHESQARLHAEDEKLKATLKVNAAHESAAQSDAKLAMTRNRLQEDLKRAEARVEIARLDEQALLKQKVVVNEAEQLRLQAEANVQVQELEGRANLKRIELEAQAEADKIRAVGEARADAERAMMMVEIDRLMKEAEVYEKYGEAALRVLAIKAMPEVAEKLAQPLNNTGKIVFMGNAGGPNGTPNGGPSVFMQDMARSMNVLNETCDSFLGTDLQAMYADAMQDPKKALALATLARSMAGGGVGNGSEFSALTAAQLVEAPAPSA